MGESAGPFTVGHFSQLGDLAVATWAAGRDRDWTALAGTLGWTCDRTARHALDSVWAPAIFLASRRTTAYPPLELSVASEATPDDYHECLRAVVNTVVGVVSTMAPDVQAIIRRRPVETAGPDDFPARSALELILHTYDIATGLRLPFDPPRELTDPLFEHTTNWPRENVALHGDSWSDLLATRGRPRPE
jgi:hypothetical protein